MPSYSQSNVSVIWWWEERERAVERGRGILSQGSATARGQRGVQRIENTGFGSLMPFIALLLPLVTWVQDEQLAPHLQQLVNAEASQYHAPRVTLPWNASFIVNFIRLRRLPTLCMSFPVVQSLSLCNGGSVLPFVENSEQKTPRWGFD